MARRKSNRQVRLDVLYENPVTVERIVITVATAHQGTVVDHEQTSGLASAGIWSGHCMRRDMDGPNGVEVEEQMRERMLLTTRLE